jgi:hypothetical protein
MSPIDELVGLLSGPPRVIVIAQKDVNLQSLEGENHLVLMKMVEGSHTAGGRGAGMGERRVIKVAHFRYFDGGCEKLFETRTENEAGEYEIPYYVSRIPLTLRDGTEAMGYGVVEPELVQQMISKMGRLP